MEESIFEKLWGHVEKEWDVIKTAPLALIILFALALLIAWFLFRERANHYKENAEAAELSVTRLKEENDKLKKRTDEADRVMATPIPESELELPLASPEELSQRKIVGKAVVISNIPRDKNDGLAIRNRHFVRCQIIGPQLLAPTGQTTLQNNSFGVASIDSILFETKAAYIQGALEINNCTFEECRFTQIGFTGAPEFLAMMRKKTK